MMLQSQQLKMRDMKLTKNQYWVVIFLAYLLIVINGILVFKLLNHEVEFDQTCPTPKEVGRCDCTYDAGGAKSLRYCFCYPGKLQMRPYNFLNISEVINGTS